MQVHISISTNLYVYSLYKICNNVIAKLTMVFFFDVLLVGLFRQTWPREQHFLYGYKLCTYILECNVQVVEITVMRHCRYSVYLPKAFSCVNVCKCVNDACLKRKTEKIARATISRRTPNRRTDSVIYIYIFYTKIEKILI